MDVLYPLMAKKLKDGNAIEKASFLFFLYYFDKNAEGLASGWMCFAR